MKVRVGWSGESDGQWFKNDVELEEDDFVYYAQEHGFVPESVSMGFKFSYMENEATMLMSAWIGRHVPLYEDSARDWVEGCLDRRADLLATIGVEPK